MGQRIGLDYAGIEAFCRINGLDVSQETFGKLQLLERTMLTVDREQHASKN